MGPEEDKSIDEILGDEGLQAVERLTRLGDRAFSRLLEILVTDVDPLRRQLAAAALGRMGRLDSKQALAQALGDPDPPVALSAMDALVKMKAPVELTDFHPLLQNELPYVRSRVMKAIGELGLLEQVPVLEEAIANDRSELVRMRASEALRRLRQE